MNKALMGIMIAAHTLWLRGDVRGVRWVSQYGANLCGANLCGADMRGANLCGANLRGANLCGANLRGANLCGANLCGADMRGADMRGADMRGADRLIGPQRSDGYLFTYCMETQLVLAGCRAMTLEEYREHAAGYADDAKRKDTLAILQCIEILSGAR